MRQDKKERTDIRHGYAAMDRMTEAGELIGKLFGEDAHENADKLVFHAFMDLVMESAEIGHELVETRDPQTIKDWLEPKRDVLLDGLKRRGMDQSQDAQCAFRKIEAVLDWVDSWAAPKTATVAPSRPNKYTERWWLLYALVGITKPIIAEIGVTSVSIGKVVTRLQNVKASTRDTKLGRFIKQIEDGTFTCYFLPLESHFGDLDRAGGAKDRWRKAGGESGVYFPQYPDLPEFQEPNNWRVWPDRDFVRQFGSIIRGRI
jgi:hypothetical protein